MSTSDYPPLNVPAGSSGFTAAVSDQPALKLTWHIRDEERVRCQLPPDGLWNAPTPCGATLAGFATEDRAAAEVEHFRTCRHGCRLDSLRE